jgi:hypothetical protein
LVYLRLKLRTEVLSISPIGMLRLKLRSEVLSKSPKGIPKTEAEN